LTASLLRKNSKTPFLLHWLSKIVAAFWLRSCPMSPAHSLTYSRADMGGKGWVVRRLRAGKSCSAQYSIFLRL
jgi:hypothetical protein